MTNRSEQLTRHKFLPLASVSLSLLFLLTAMTLLTLPVSAQSGSVRGNVSYVGQLPPPHPIVVVLATSTTPPPAQVIQLAQPGPYEFTGVADGLYFVAAFVDLNQSGGLPEAGEPYSWYDPDGDGNPNFVLVSGGALVSGIDLVVAGPWVPLGGPIVPGGQADAIVAHPQAANRL